jgi:mono/diheme cytochrome c family protein
MPIGRFLAANLTPAGELKRWSDGQIFRAIRNSIDNQGRWLMIMSFTNASNLSDEDIRAVIAYIRSVPAAGRLTPSPPDQFNPLGIALLALGFLPGGHPVRVDSIEAPPKAATAEYGQYILSYQDCRACHGANLRGGVPSNAVTLVGPSLEIVRSWTPAQFIATLRTGVDPYGHELDSNRMPRRELGKMDNEELEAVYRYVSKSGQSTTWQPERTSRGGDREASDRHCARRYAELPSHGKDWPNVTHAWVLRPF